MGPGRDRTDATSGLKPTKLVKDSSKHPVQSLYNISLEKQKYLA